jgi:hypothetical protein
MGRYLWTQKRSLARWGDATAVFLIDAQSFVLVTIMKARGLQST